MPDFTKGPWKVFTGRDHDNYPYQIVAVAPEVPITTWGAICRKAKREGQANAQLIAAAPEMYDALKLILETHCCDSGEADYVAEWDGDHTVCADCRPAYAALAKADQP